MNKTKKAKGHFNDIDKFSEKHQKIINWFLNESNRWHFVRFFMHDIPISNIKILLEEPVKSKTDYLLGYIDIILSYNTDYNEHQNILIEAKSSFSDYGEVLRQIKTYREYRNDITKLCLITDKFASVDWENDEEFNYYIECEKFFQSQGIYFINFNELDFEIDFLKEPLKFKEYHRYTIPHGRRNCEVLFLYEKNNLLTIAFFAIYDDPILKHRETDLLTSQNLIHMKERIFQELGNASPDEPLPCNILFFYDFDGNAIIREINLDKKLLKIEK